MPRSCPRLLLPLLLLLSACQDHAANGSNGPDSQAGTDADAARLDPAPCQVSERFSLLESAADSLPVALALSGRHLGLVFEEEGSPRLMRFLVASLDDLTRVDQGTLMTNQGVFVPATIFAVQQGFVAALPQYAQPPTGIDLWQIVPGADPVLQALEGQAEMLSQVAGAQANDQLHLAWTSASTLNVAAGKDLTTLSVREPVQADTGTTNTALSMASDAGGVAVVWVNRRSPGQHDKMLFAKLAADGQAAPPKLLVEHDRYIYETAMAFGTRRFAIATHDSRVDILNVPLYLTLVEQDGSTFREGIRLTSDHGQEEDSVDIAWGGNAFAVVSIAFESGSTTNEMQVYLHQVDEAGEPLFEPLQVSQATVREHDCCIRVRNSQIVSVGPASYLVVWSEQAELAPDKLTYVIRGARAACRD